MLQDRVMFEEKLKRGLVPDGEGGWVTIEAAILKEKARHRQSKLWTPESTVSEVKRDEVIPEDKPENMFFEKSVEAGSTETKNINSEELLISDPVEDTTVVDLHDDDEDTAVHEIENKAPDTTIIETVAVPETLAVSNEIDTVALDRDEVMKDVESLEETPTELDGLAEDFGNIIDSFAAAETSTKSSSIEEVLHPDIEDVKSEKETTLVKINDAKIDLPPSSSDSDEIVFDLSDDFAAPTNKEIKPDESIEDWEESGSSFWSKILIPAVLVISAAVLTAVIIIVT